MENFNMIEKKLYDATVKGDVETFEALMREDELLLAQVSVTCCFNRTPLHIAAMLGHFDFAKSLLLYKPSFATWLDSQDRAPLHLACANGYVNIVILLLQEDPSVCLVQDEADRTPLHLAIMNGQYESINKLVEANPEVTWYTSEHGETILHWCVIYNRLKPLILLMESITIDEDFANAKDESGSTILHTATALKHICQVKFLLTRREIRVNEINGNGLTALDIIDEMPKEVKTIKIKELLISVGALRAKEVGKTTNELAKNVERTDLKNSSTAQNSTELCGNKKVKRWSILKKEGKNKGDSLLVAATVLAAMAYQVAISPPGGIIGMDANEKLDTGHNIKAGTSILAQHDPIRSKLFWIFNTISFIASLSIIFLFASGISAKRKFFIWVLRAGMWITVPSMALAYLLAAVTFVPDPNIHNSTYVTLMIAAVTWYGLIIVSLSLLVYCLILAVSKKAKKSRNRILRNTGVGIHVESTTSIV